MGAKKSKQLNEQTIKSLLKETKFNRQQVNEFYEEFLVR